MLVKADMEATVGTAEMEATEGPSQEHIHSTGRSQVPPIQAEILVLPVMPVREDFPEIQGREAQWGSPRQCAA